MSWQVEFQYTSGGAWDDVTDLVLINTLRRAMTYHNELKPTTNTCDFEMLFDSSVVTNLLTNDDIDVRVHLDSDDWFTGTVRNNFRIRARQRVEPVKVECVDYAEKLTDRMKFTDAWANYTVINTSNTATSIVHQLLSEHGGGITLASGTSSIAKTVAYFTNVDGVDDMSYGDALTRILFEFGYCWTFNESGELVVFDLFPASISTSNQFDGDNTRGELGITKRREEYDAVEVQWWRLGSAADAVIFKDTTGGSAGREMAVSIDDGDFYPIDDGTTAYAEYEYDGLEIVYADGIDLVFDPTSKFTENTLTNYYKRAEVEIENTSGATAELTRFNITGDVVYKEQLNIVRSEGYAAADDKLEIETEYIASKADAERLCTGVRQYYEYADFEYELISDTDYDVGDYAYVVDGNLSINNLCRIVSKETYLLNDDNVQYRYFLEGADEYTAETPTSTAEPKPVTKKPEKSEPDLGNVATGVQPNGTAESGDVRIYQGKLDDDTTNGFRIQEYNGETWETRFDGGMRTGGNVADMFVSGFFQAGESVLSSPGLIWRDETPSVSYGFRKLVQTDNAVIASTFGSSNSSEIIRSTDGGDSWSSAISHPFGTSRIFDMAEGNGVVVAVAEGGKVARSTDDGASWGSLIPNPLATATVDAVSVGYDSVNGLWLIGGFQILAYSTNDGATWTEISGHGLTSTVDSLINTGTAWIAGVRANGAYRSTNGGSSWTLVEADVADGSIEITVSDYSDGVLFIANRQGTSIFRSVDDGQTWTELTLPSRVFSITNARGLLWGCSISGGIVISSDNGQTWSDETTTGNAISTPTTEALLCILYVESNDRIITAGSGPVMLYSEWLEAGSGIVEQGSNSNGYYVVFSSGLQVCFFEVDATGYNISSSSYYTWTYPKAFGATPIIRLGTVRRPASDTVAMNCRQGAVNSSTQSNWGHTAGSSTGGYFNLFAIGFA